MPNAPTLLVILHNPAGSMGLLEEKLRTRGFTPDIICPLAGDPLPDPADYDAAIVFGGKMSVNDDSLSALKDELCWIKRMVNAEKPFLGICLGAQLLARTFGGHVTRHQASVVEVGYYAIYPTIDGYLSFFADAPPKFFQWHNEGFTLPEGAVKLAASDLYPNQAFRIGEHAYGFQFHPEATLEQIQLWHERDADELAHPGAQTVPTQLRDNAELAEPISRWLDGFLDHWLAPLTKGH